MSGTYFVICIPTKEKESSPTNQQRNNEIKNDVHVTIDNSTEPCNKSIKSSGKTARLQRTQSFEDISHEKHLWNVPRSGIKTRKSENELRKLKEEKEDMVNVRFEKDNHNANNLELKIANDSPMEVVLRQTLKMLNIENDSWQTFNESYKVSFSVPNEILHNKILKIFSEWGIGERSESSITMIPCTMIMPIKVENEAFMEELSKDYGLWHKFMNSVNARINVAKIVNEVRQDAALNFDFVTLIVIAGIMAAFGLVENSVISLTSSMLISPLMGPLIAATFSTVIKDKQLMKFGVINELIGIFLATFVGFVFGLIVGTVDERYGLGDGLNEEILSRCEIHALVIGVFTAIPSGAAVAIAILGENIGSLVGVAISASLLPPAVNAGLLWAMAVLFMAHQNDDRFNQIVKSQIYSEHQAVELAILGSISMAVTIINIVCIYVMGILFLKIKEVAPMVSKSQRQFWKHDVKVARDYNRTTTAGDAKSLDVKLFEDFVQNYGNKYRHSLLDQVKHNTQKSNQYTWSPMMSTTRNTRISLRELENIHNNSVTGISDESRQTRRLSRVGSIAKSLSPPRYQYHLLQQSYDNNQRYNSMASSSNTQSDECRYNISKMVSETLSPIDESSQIEIEKETLAKTVPVKSKFTVTPADDPLFRT